MPVKNFLKDNQKQHLQQALKESDCAEFRERVLMLLLMNDGKTYEEIAAFLGCSRRTVVYWCVHGDPDKLESLQDRRKIGNYRKATPVYIKLLLETIEKEPSELGYEFGRWTGDRLATYLAEKTGIQLTGSQIRKILKEKKYVYLWAKSSLESKQNPILRREFREKLSRYIEVAKIYPNQLQVWFWDESGFSLRVVRRKTWGDALSPENEPALLKRVPDYADSETEQRKLPRGAANAKAHSLRVRPRKKGKRKKITGQRRRGRVNVMGGLRYSDKKRLCYFVNKGNADTFYQQLKQLNEFVLQEWVAQGNLAEDFHSLGPTIIIILDNASYHKRQDIRTEIEANLPNIILEFLPAYSPDFNLIELVWHSCKEFIAHRLFKSVFELESMLDKLLNMGELVIKWGRKIKNKGNAVSAT